ncbi:hypothetical protein MT325_m392L [Paramecium bursaria chlorella virus MT325]|uniref:Uncharacterized protein m392L n=2 Tax=Paramecium bursaria Chlorella virus A1 TaxID=381899 RepID=A7IUC2_PBCVM|nr:hypothetical protein FR483_n407L [Paramecium bursaria Chlorella virus FR483]ABT13946.1 hypothetical protein MT325_m392L [Paramecium bursaria chlorella virus MT325]ABT15692.1 hypothetical protein FR483_n407L [Paramecium bursaria Chlorella virus FR483]
MSFFDTSSKGLKNGMPSWTTSVSIPERLSYFWQLPMFCRMFSKQSSLLCPMTTGCGPSVLYVAYLTSRVYFSYTVLS